MIKGIHFQVTLNNVLARVEDTKYWEWREAYLNQEKPTCTGIFQALLVDRK